MIFQDTKPGDTVVQHYKVKDVEHLTPLTVKKVTRDYVITESGSTYSRRTGRSCGPCGGGGMCGVEIWITIPPQVSEKALLFGVRYGGGPSPLQGPT